MRVRKLFFVCCFVLVFATIAVRLYSSRVRRGNEVLVDTKVSPREMVSNVQVATTVPKAREATGTDEFSNDLAIVFFVNHIKEWYGENAIATFGLPAKVDLVEGGYGYNLGDLLNMPVFYVKVCLTCFFIIIGFHLCRTGLALRI
jgi:hypothetical protein